jgi:hypothetical protein
MIKSRNTDARFCKESQLLAPVSRFACQLGFCIQQAELPFYEYRIDLYAFSATKDATVAFELKLTNWRRALQQALLYQLSADYVYIAMPETAAIRVDQAELQAEGIGLIAVHISGLCMCILEAEQHSEVREFYRGSHISYLKESANA